MKIGIGLVALGLLVLPFTLSAQETDSADQCDGLVSGNPERMYDFKLGNWNHQWQNKTQDGGVFEFGAVARVYTILGGDVLLDEQVAEDWKGITFRTYDPDNKKWIVRWLPSNSEFNAEISAGLEHCVPVERHQQVVGEGKLIQVRTSFTDITENSFEFHQDWSTDEGETWIRDVLFYRATRAEKVESN